MSTTKTSHVLGLFFMVAGAVYAGPAIGDEGAPGATSANEATAPADSRMEMPADLASEPAPPASEPVADEPMTVEAIPASDTPESTPNVRVGSFGQIDLHVKDLELTKVLQLLSLQSERNIVASRNVTGKVSADLYGVGFYEALDAILHTNGYGYVEKGNFIYVYTAQELAEIEEAQRKTETKIVRLNYLNAADASAFVSPLLSGAGSISVSGEPATGFQPTLSDAGANTFSQADTLIIRDYPENIDQILAVLEELDVRPKQVLIESTILQARLSEANAFGVDFAIFTDLDLTDFTTPLGAIDDLIAGEGPGGDFDSGGAITGSPGNVAQGQSTVKLGFLGDDAAVFIRALDTVTDTTVLATPKVVVLNRQRADLLVGEKLGYLSTTATETSTTQTVEFLDVGTQLTVRPFVSEDGFVRLELRPAVSDGSTELRGGFVIPNETTQELTTNVIVRSGQTIVLGGLFKEDTTIGRRQVPGLGDVPIVGSAFKGQDDTVERSEVIFLIRPTVLKDQALYAAGERAERGVELAHLGARKGLLPWSRTKLTSSHVKKAYEYLEAGNEDKALWHTNLALYLDPGMVDALRLKETITGEQIYVHDRSILNDAIDAMILEELGEEVGALPEATPMPPAEPTDPTDAAETEAEAAADVADEAAADEPIATPVSDTSNVDQAAPAMDMEMSADESFEPAVAEVDVEAE